MTTIKPQGWFRFTVLLCLAVVLEANENGGNENEAKDGDAEEYNNNYNGQSSYSSKAYSTSKVINPDAFLDVNPTCSNQVEITSGLKIKVTSVYLICDSPGAYYHGSSTTYRNSAVCTEGDTAKLDIELSILENTKEQSGTEYIYISLDSGFYNVFTNVFSGSRLCQMDMTPETTGAACPTPGNYKLNFAYEVQADQVTNEYESLHYTPDIRVSFENDSGQFAGCATAGMAGWRKNHEIKARNGVIAVGIAVVGFSVIFALTLWYSYRRRKRLERLAERKTQRYQYFGTLPNGQVVPFPPPNHRPPPPPHHGQQHYHQQQQYHAQQMQHIEHMQRLQHQHQQYMLHQQQQQAQGHVPYHPAMHQAPPTPPHDHPDLQQQHSHMLYDDSSEEGTPQRPQQQQRSVAAAYHQPQDSDIHMISNPAYNETQLPTRPII